MLTSRQRSLVHRFTRLLPSLPQSIRGTRHFLRCHLARADTHWFSFDHTPHLKTRIAAPLGSEGYCVESRVVGYRGNGGRPFRQNRQVQDKESGSRQGDAG